MENTNDLEKEMENVKELPKRKTAYELFQEATALLKKKGYDMWGQTLSRKQFLKSRFEQSIPVMPYYGRSRRGK